jgi:hypothetical protein
MKYRDKEFLEEMGCKGLGNGGEYGLVEMMVLQW